jgi:hypothetical protein
LIHPDRQLACPTASGRDLYKLLIFYRKFQLKSTSSRLIVAHANEPVMVGDDGRDDCQAESGAALARGKIWLKDSGTDTRVDATAVVGNFKCNYATCRIEYGADYDLRAYAIVAISARSGDCVVKQVNQRAFKRFPIDANDWQRGL